MFEPILIAITFAIAILWVLEYAAEEWRETFGNGENEQ